MSSAKEAGKVTLPGSAGTRIAELEVVSRVGGVATRWRYHGGERYEERAVLGEMRSWLVRLAGSIDGVAASIVLNVHEVRREHGGTPGLGFGLERRPEEQSLELARPASELIAEALAALERE